MGFDLDLSGNPYTQNIIPGSEGLDDLIYSGSTDASEMGQIEDPTIADILGWTSTDAPSSRARAGGFLSNLLDQAGLLDDWGIESGGPMFTGLLTGSGASVDMGTGQDEGFGLDTLQAILGQADFANMSTEDFEAAITSAYDPMMQAFREQGTTEYTPWEMGDWQGKMEDYGTAGEAYEAWSSEMIAADNWGEDVAMGFEDFKKEATAGTSTFIPTYTDVGFQEGGLEGMTNYLQAMQEGFKALPTQEDWGLGKKTADVYEKETQDIASAYQGYIPGEIMSRYGSLQGKGGEAAGEMGESQYLADVYGLGRQTGRDVRGLQEDFEKDWRSSSRSWLESLT